MLEGGVVSVVMSIGIDVRGIYVGFKYNVVHECFVPHRRKLFLPGVPFLIL